MALVRLRLGECVVRRHATGRSPRAARNRTGDTTVQWTAKATSGERALAWRGALNRNVTSVLRRPRPPPSPERPGIAHSERNKCHLALQEAFVFAYVPPQQRPAAALTPQFRFQRAPCAIGSSLLAPESFHACRLRPVQRSERCEKTCTDWHLPPMVEGARASAGSATPRQPLALRAGTGRFRREAPSTSERSHRV